MAPDQVRGRQARHDSADVVQYDRDALDRTSIADRKSIALATTERSQSVSVNTKRVFYVKYLADPVYAEILGRRSDVRLDRLENESQDDVAGPILAAANVYQVGSARDENSRHFHVDTALIARMPHALVVSTSGAGYDTVDIKACTDAGILVVNQAGGNREAVAEHALGMLIAPSKRIPETNQVMRRQPLIDRFP